MSAPIAPGHVPISAVIMTKNEADNIAACCASVAWADEVLVVDSFSTDDTVTLAKEAGARIVQHPFTNYAAQRNFAQSQAAHDWVLFVDADERVSLALRDEIVRLAANGDIKRYNAYHIQRVHLFSGRWFSAPPDRVATPEVRAAITRHEVCRLFDRRQAAWHRALHEVVSVPEPHGVLDGVICHYSSTNLSLALEDFNAYTSIEAAFLHRQGKRINVLGALWRGARTFAFHYVLQGWYRHGENGLLLAAVAGMTKFINYAKLWERRQIEAGRGIWTDADRKMLERYQVEDQD